MITLDEYFIGRKHSKQQLANATDLLAKVNQLLNEIAKERGFINFEHNPSTNSLISGKTEGGFRLPDCMQGAARSSHKEASGVDIYDPSGVIDTFISSMPNLLVKHGLYREAPSVTRGWCHLTTRPPASGKRTFYP